MIKNLFKNTKKGFTLVELLIVISIIGVLATLLMANFIGVRQRARDAQRKSDIRQIQSALEMYRADNGSYPVANAAVGSNGFQSDTGDSACGGNGGIVFGTTVYMKSIPCDPLKTDEYAYWINGSGYELVACLENSNDKDLLLPSDPNYLCNSGNRAGRYRFQVSNP